MVSVSYRDKREPGLKDTWKSAAKGGNIEDRRGSTYGRAMKLGDEYMRTHPNGPVRKPGIKPGQKRYAPNGRVR